MTTDDDRIRRLLSEAAPASDGVKVEAVARRAAKAQRRRTAVTLIAVPVTTLAVIGATVLGVDLVQQSRPGPVDQPTNGDVPALVPWVDAPAQAYVPPPSAGSTTTTPEATPPCTPEALSVSWGPTETTPSRSSHTLWLRNTSGRSCSLSGYPTVVASSSQRGVPGVTAANAKMSHVGGDLAPGERAHLELETRSICRAHPDGGGTPVYYNWVAVTLPHVVGTIELPATGSHRLDLKCGLATSTLVPDLSDQEPGAGTLVVDPWRDLSVGVLAGLAHQESGGALVYEVFLTNKTSSDISFADRCPSYVERLTSDATGLAVAEESHQLNCQAAPVIPAGGRVRYEMKLANFPGVAGVPFTLTWSLAMPSPPQGFDLVSAIGADPSAPTPSQGQTYEYVSPKGVKITVEDVSPGQRIASPWTVNGHVPGSWSFEADFPVLLRNADGRVIARGIGQLTGDWMTEDLVPFSVTLSFDPQHLGSMGTLVLQKDNPTGKTQFDDSVEIPVTFGD